MIEINLFFDPWKIYLLSLFSCICAIGERLYIEYKFSLKEDKNIMLKDILISITPILNTIYTGVIFCNAIMSIFEFIIKNICKKIKSIFQKK